MPTNDIYTEATKQDGNLLKIAVRDLDEENPQFKPFDVTVFKQSPLMEKGQIVLDQEIEPIPDPVFNGAFRMVWHIETIVDPVTGFEYRRKILDSIVKL